MPFIPNVSRIDGRYCERLEGRSYQVLKGPQSRWMNFLRG